MTARKPLPRSGVRMSGRAPGFRHLYERARIVLDLAKQKIEIIIGESVQDEPAPDTWSDDDV